MLLLTGSHQQQQKAVHLNNNFNEAKNMGIIGEFFMFLKSRKRFWLWPLFIFLITLGLFLFLAQGSALAPFIYSLF